MNKDVIVTLGSMLIGSILLASLYFYFANEFAPGSYPYAEIYNFNVSEDVLIKAAEKVKYTDSAYILPSTVPLIDGRRNSDDHWYHLYFYVPSEKRIIKTWIRASDKQTTKFAFVGISMGPNLGSWSMINRNFGAAQNKLEKEKFQNGLLRKIQKELQMK